MYKKKVLSSSSDSNRTRQGKALPLKGRLRNKKNSSAALKRDEGGSPRASTRSSYRTGEKEKGISRGVCKGKRSGTRFF